MSTDLPPVDEGSRTAPQQDNNNLTSSQSAFGIHVPALSAAQRASLTSDVAAAPNGVTTGGKVPVIILESDEEEHNVAEKEKLVGTKTEGIFRIVRGQEVDGVNRSFIVQLKEGEKMVKRTREEVKELAPNLLSAFETVVINSSPDLSQDDEVIITGVTAAKSKHGKLSDVEILAKARAAKEALSKTLAKGKGKAKRPVDSDLEEELELNDEDEGEDELESEGNSYDEDEADSGASDESASGDDDYQQKGSKTKSKGPKRSPKKPSRKTQRVDRLQAASEADSSRGSSIAGSTFTAPAPVGRRSGREKVATIRYEDGASDSESSTSELLSQLVPNSPRKSRSRKAMEEIAIDDSDEDIEGGAEGEDRPQDLHSYTCIKCQRAPADELLEKFRKKAKRVNKKKRRNEEDMDTDQEEESLLSLGAWFECGVCIDSYHFGCLPGALRTEIVNSYKAEHAALHAPPPTEDPILDQDADTMDVDYTPVILPAAPPLPPRTKIELDISRVLTMPKCWGCKRVGGRRCFECGVSGRKRLEDKVVVPDKLSEETMSAPSVAETTVIVADTLQEVTAKALPAPGFMFRCVKCKRPAHYDCLEKEDDDYSSDEHVGSYFNDGRCHQCFAWNVPLDVILAWAVAHSPLPIEEEDGDDVAVRQVVQRIDEKTGEIFEVPSAKDSLANAKYLVKWQGLGYRQLEWVPHAFLVASAPAKLSNFLAKGSQISFEAPNDDEPEDGEEPAVRSKKGGAPGPDLGAIDRIPKAWSTVDRVLEVYYKANKAGGESILHRKYKNLPEDPEESIKLVEECYFKWKDLAYSAASTEAPPEPEEEGYEDYVKAYKAYLVACNPSMLVPILSKKDLAALDTPRNPKQFVKLKTQPDSITGGTLMDFQLEGVNFLYYQWWIRSGCILADEMGLGKTLQTISLLAMLSKDRGARPFLVTVPNSTIGNWMREFARWAPAMRVVPYAGDAESRKIVEDYEMFDTTGTSLKTHVVLATYEALEKNIGVFRRVARWDVLVVDEGQRLKSGPKGLLFDALQSLNINLRILLSGTPLNNNLTELFNLLHFINPSKYGNTKELEERYEVLNEEKVLEIHEHLKPHFLRRTKESSLDLPPMTEIVVPVTMVPLQRQLYRSILERNAAAIESIFHVSKTHVAAAKGRVKKANFNNILMELRKLLGHPYLISPDLEPLGVSEQQQHTNLTEASAKLVLLSLMLPKLKAAGNRVLVFSQFKLTLNILEDFLVGLKLKYLRLDGDTASLDRQRGIDAFNAPNSDYFLYLLSTRAGGAGINLATADTVILFDQDFNPHQDLQATSRAHRIGQTKPVRVFKLLVKGTCEERIFQQGNKKLGLDHIIIQRLDATADSEDVEGVLQFGAKAIFNDDEAEATAIRYTDKELDKLLDRSKDVAIKASNAGPAAFSHARIWERDGLVEVGEESSEQTDQSTDQAFWARILEEKDAAAVKLQAAKDAQVGRGKRSRGAVTYAVDDLLPDENSRKRRKETLGEQAFGVDGLLSEEESDDDFLPRENYRDDLGERTPSSTTPSLATLSVRTPVPSMPSRAAPLGPEQQAQLLKNDEAKRIARNVKRQGFIENLRKAGLPFEDGELNDLIMTAVNHGENVPLQTNLINRATARLNKLIDIEVELARLELQNAKQGASTVSSIVPVQSPALNGNAPAQPPALNGTPVANGIHGQQSAANSPPVANTVPSVPLPSVVAASEAPVIDLTAEH